MFKGDLVQAIAENCNVTPYKAEKILNFSLNAIKNELTAGNPIVFARFGSLVPVQRAARKIRLFGGRKRKIPARVMPVFRASETLKQAMNPPPPKRKPGRPRKHPVQPTDIT